MIKNILMRRGMLTSAAFLPLIALGAAASAHGVASTGEAQGSNVADAASEPTPDNAAVPESGDIVVTATRQATSIGRVPISLSAYSQQTLDVKGVKSIQDVIRFTPGVTFSLLDNKIAIRGISSDAGAGTTGIYIDDMSIGAGS